MYNSMYSAGRSSATPLWGPEFRAPSRTAKIWVRMSGKYVDSDIFVFLGACIKLGYTVVLCLTTHELGPKY